MMNKFYLRRLLNNVSLIKYFNSSTTVSKLYSKNKFKNQYKASKSFTKEEIIGYNEVRKYGFQKSICAAADSNLYFDMYGNASLCCYNRKFLLGNVNEQSLMEIWEGEAIKEARKKFRENDLVKGCSMCYLNIKNGEYGNAMAMNYDSFGLPNSKYPSRMEFELSNICNLECVMCNGDFSNLIRKNREKRPAIPLAYGNSFLNQLDEFIPHLQFANFLGGEPQLINIYYSIWEKLMEHGKAIIRVQTNASILQPKFLELVTKSKQFQISVSMDALRKSTVESIRKNIEHDKFIKNLEHLIALHRQGDIILSFAVCPLTTNRDEIIEMTDYANQQNIQISFNQVIQPYYVSLASLSSAEIRNLINDLQVFTEQNKSNVNTSSKKFNLNQIVNLQSQLINWEQRKLVLEENYAKMSGNSLEHIQDHYFKELDKIVEQLNASDIDAEEVRTLIDQKANDLDEEKKKHIYMKLLEMPLEYDNVDFHEQKRSGYIHIIDTYIDSVLKHNF